MLEPSGRISEITRAPLGTITGLASWVHKVETWEAPFLKPRFCSVSYEYYDRIQLIRRSKMQG
jgi:hypothetical protein